MKGLAAGKFFSIGHGEGLRFRLLPGHGVSARHAVIFKEEHEGTKQYVISPRQGHVGLQGRFITTTLRDKEEKAVLYPGTRFKIGEHTFEVVDKEKEALPPVVEPPPAPLPPGRETPVAPPTGGLKRRDLLAAGLGFGAGYTLNKVLGFVGSLFGEREKLPERPPSVDGFASPSEQRPLDPHQVPVLTLHTLEGDGPERLERQLSFLKANGYRTVLLKDLVNTKGKLPAKTIAIAVDDGYLDAYTVVRPLLKKYGFNATFFVITGKLHDSHSPNGIQMHAWADAVKGKIARGYADDATDSAGDHPRMTWKMVEELFDEGFDVQSHTHDLHTEGRYPIDVSEEEIEYDLRKSKKLLEQHLNQYRPSSFNLLAWPTGRHNAGPRAENVASRLGFITYGFIGKSERRIDVPSPEEKMNRERIRFPLDGKDDLKKVVQ